MCPRQLGQVTYIYLHELYTQYVLWEAAYKRYFIKLVEISETLGVKTSPYQEIKRQSYEVEVI